MWKRIRIDKPPVKREAYVTIGNGYIHFGKYACELIPGCLENRYAEFLRSDTDNHLVGVLLSKEKHEDTLEMRRAYSRGAGKEGELCTSFRLISAPALRVVFGDIADSPVVLRYKVTIDEEMHDMFVVDVSCGEPVNEQKKEEDEEPVELTDNEDKEEDDNSTHIADTVEEENNNG